MMKRRNRIRLLALGCAGVVAAAVAALGGGHVATAHAATAASLLNVKATGGIMSVTVTVDYAGSGPVTLTVGKTQDVLGSKVKQVWKNQPYQPGKWSLTATGLESGTQYWLRLDAYGATWTSPAAVKTYTRSVVIDYNTLHVVDDGDGWPKGCGDFVFTKQIDHGQYLSSWPYPYWPKASGSELCLDSGQTIGIPDTWGRWTNPDVPHDSVREEFYAWDDDLSCVAGFTKCYADCGVPFALNPTCGDLGYGYDYVDLRASGIHALTLEASGGLIDGNAVDVIIYGYVTVSYWP
jgi:hypothetical protein